MLKEFLVPLEEQLKMIQRASIPLLLESTKPKFPCLHEQNIKQKQHHDESSELMMVQARRKFHSCSTLLPSMQCYVGNS